LFPQFGLFFNVLFLGIETKLTNKNILETLKNTMIRYLLTLICFTQISILSSQEVNIKLQINNTISSQPVKSATFVINASSFQTDSSGSLDLYLEKGKSQTIHIHHPDFITYSIKCLFERDTVLKISMAPNIIELDEVTVEASKNAPFTVSHHKDIEGAVVFAGKKAELLKVQEMPFNLSSNNSRQVFSKVPGLNVFENDASGVSIAIGGRGLNPSRVLHFNTRQNGYDMSADPMGYPESYYTPPLEAVEQIDVIRGAASLQYGTQFGGSINYQLKEASKKKLAGNFSQTVGSYGYFNSFNQLSGTLNKLSYSTFYQFKTYNGWRDRSKVNNHTAFAGLKYAITPRLSLNAEYTYMNYLAQQAGGLTDDQFNKDASQVIRKRNWFGVNWNLFSVGADYKLNKQSVIKFTTFGLVSGRDALGYLGKPTEMDDTSAYRTLMKDAYRNYGAELKYVHEYKLMKKHSHFLIGARYFRGNTSRQQGNADKGSEPNFVFLHPENLENSDYAFPNTNYALFTENVIRLSNRYTLVPGLRFEHIITQAEGYYRYIKKNSSGVAISDEKVYEEQNNARSFVLFGLGQSFKLTSNVEVYANLSQNYRAINFNDLRVTNPNAAVDPNLQDERGYTGDIGFRGELDGVLIFDVSAFYMNYDNRIGSISRYDSVKKQTVVYRSNIGKSINQGLEAFAELNWIKMFNKRSIHKLNTFISASYVSAVYQTQLTVSNGKQVEYAPKYILRSGMSYGYRGLGVSLQYSYTEQQFSDANNTSYSGNGLTGIIPAYSMVDFSIHYSIRKLKLSAGSNNLTNSKYFTRRADGFPGPGIIPADPINYYLTLGFKF
jgi:Fe(3+) dicitrate transport protein